MEAQARHRQDSKTIGPSHTCQKPHRWFCFSPIKWLPIMLRTVSEAPRPQEEIGWSGAGAWPWWFRYGVMKEALPSLAPNCYAFCIGDGWCPDLNADPTVGA